MHAQKIQAIKLNKQLINKEQVNHETKTIIT